MSVSGLPGSKFWGKKFFDSAEHGVRSGSRPPTSTLNRYDVPAAEVARWNKVAGEPLWEEWVKKMEGKGHKEARDILKSALELAKNDAESDVIPGAAKSEPGIQTRARNSHLDSGLRPAAARNDAIAWIHDGNS